MLPSSPPDKQEGIALCQSSFVLWGPGVARLLLRDFLSSFPLNLVNRLLCSLGNCSYFWSSEFTLRQKVFTAKGVRAGKDIPALWRASLGCSHPHPGLFFWVPQIYPCMEELHVPWTESQNLWPVALPGAEILRKGVPGASAHLQSLGVKRRAGPARWHMALPKGLGSLFNPLSVAWSPLPATLWGQICSVSVQAYPSIISPLHFSWI